MFEYVSDILKQHNTRASCGSNSGQVTSFLSVKEMTPTGHFLHKNMNCLNVLNSGNIETKNLKGFGIWHEAVDNPQNREYLKWIMDQKESPWKNLISAQPEQNLDVIFNHGFALTNLDFPSNFVVNFLTAFRWSHEKPTQTELWWKLVEAGVTKPVAFVIANSLLGKGNDWQIGSIDWHSSINASVMGYEAVKNFSKGVPNVIRFTRHLFSKNTSNTPVNVIWSSDNKDFFADFNTCGSKKLGKFPSSNQIIKSKTLNTLIEFGKKADEKCLCV